MKTDLQDLCIDTVRFRERFEALAAMGAAPGEGVRRPAYSEAHVKRVRWFLAAVCPAKMIVVPSAEGRSHSAWEFTA